MVMAGYSQVTDIDLKEIICEVCGVKIDSIRNDPNWDGLWGIQVLREGKNEFYFFCSKEHAVISMPKYKLLADPVTN